MVFIGLSNVLNASNRAEEKVFKQAYRRIYQQDPGFEQNIVRVRGYFENLLHDITLERAQEIIKEEKYRIAFAELIRIEEQNFDNDRETQFSFHQRKCVHLTGKLSEERAKQIRLEVELANALSKERLLVRQSKQAEYFRIEELERIRFQIGLIKKDLAAAYGKEEWKEHHVQNDQNFSDFSDSDDDDFLLSNTEEEKAFREAYVHVCELQESIEHSISDLSYQRAQAQESLEFHRANLTEKRACEIVQEEEYRKAVKEKSFKEACIPFSGGYNDYDEAESKCNKLKEGLSKERIKTIELEIQLSKVTSHMKFIESRGISCLFPLEEKSKILAQEEQMIRDLEIELSRVEVTLSEDDIKKISQ